MHLEGVKHFQSLSTKTSKIDGNVPKSSKWQKYPWEPLNCLKQLRNFYCEKNTPKLSKMHLKPLNILKTFRITKLINKLLKWQEYI